MLLKFEPHISQMHECNLTAVNPAACLNYKSRIDPYSESCTKCHHVDQQEKLTQPYNYNSNFLLNHG